MENKTFVYIVVSQSGTAVSRALRFVTRARYNHVSLALDPALQEMYSFGRRRVNNPLVGGFVRETPQTGVFGRFRETEAVVLRIPVDREAYAALQARMQKMYACRHRYCYDFLGVALAYFGKTKPRSQKSYCSKFVAEQLQTLGVIRRENRVYRPMDFLQLACVEPVFSGKLRAYRPAAEE